MSGVYDAARTQSHLWRLLYPRHDWGGVAAGGCPPAAIETAPSKHHVIAAIIRTGAVYRFAAAT